MKAKTRTALVVAAPLVAVATLMVGLRVGAGSAFHAALVYGAAPGAAPTENTPRPYAFQIMTYLEDRGVRETVPLERLSVVARTDDGQESRWIGSSNADGIAEVALSFVEPTRRIGIEVRVAGESEPLAMGIIKMSEAPRIDPEERRRARDGAAVRPSKREGTLDLDVFVDGGRLVVGDATSMWLELTIPQGRDRVVNVHATPEIGVRFESETVENNGAPVVELRAIALGQAASALIEATGKDGLRGTWFGTLPTAPGAFSIRMPAEVYAKEPPATALVVAPNPRNVLYVEIDDVSGRVFGAALPLAIEPGDSVPVAHVPIPTKLSPGTHWLVASGNPRGAEKLSGATIARAFEVLGPDRTRPIGPDHDAISRYRNARQVAVGFPRWLAIDGIATRGAQNRSRHRRGLFIGLVALGAAAILEAILLTAAAREARLVLAQADNESPERVTAKPPGGGLAVALLVALLGFAFLAALIIAKA